MRTIQFSPLSVAVCGAALAFAAAAEAAGDKAAFDAARVAAKTAYEAAAKRCDASSGNARDICVASAKAARTRTEVNAEAAYRDTPKARENAATEIAEADYRIARERCDDTAGNDKDVCIKVAKARLSRAKTHARANRQVAETRTGAARDKLDADYKLAAEKCEALSGDAKSACAAQARARYGK